MNTKKLFTRCTNMCNSCRLLPSSELLMANHDAHDFGSWRTSYQYEYLFNKWLVPSNDQHTAKNSRSKRSVTLKQRTLLSAGGWKPNILMTHFFPKNIVICGFWVSGNIQPPENRHSTKIVNMLRQEISYDVSEPYIFRRFDLIVI